MIGSQQCRRSIWFVRKASQAIMCSSTRWFGTRSIKACLPNARRALHLKIAEEIERRSGNRLTEVAEVLAHHYSQTDRADKAFCYLSMAGSKSLSVYSLDEAATHFNAGTCSPRSKTGLRFGRSGRRFPCPLFRSVAPKHAIQ